MAHYDIKRNKKGELQARIQVSGKDVTTGKSKIFPKTVYEWITKNPVCGTKVGATKGDVCLKEVNEKQVFSIKESQEFLCALDAAQEKHIQFVIPIKLMLLTGMRIAEIHGLRWSDIDFDNRIIHVRRNRLYAQGFGWYEKLPKTKTSFRDIPIPQTLIADLETYKDWFRLADSSFDDKLDEYYIASNINRESTRTNSIGPWLKDFENRHGFKNVTPHGLRHTYCSILLSQNVPIQTVSKYMGHSDSTVTLKVYSHFIPDTQDKAIQALNAIIKKQE